jgi:hypothetical protein
VQIADYFDFGIFFPVLNYKNHPNMPTPHITREQFMAFFRDDEKLNELAPDDRIEIFGTILLGNSDITVELLQEILSDYGVSHLKAIEVEEDA